MAALKQELVSIIRGVEMRRVWAMPSKNTFSIAPIRALVKKYLYDSKVSVDPFARNSRLAAHTNDLNPDTSAEYHMEAGDFLQLISEQGVRTDLIIFDPPYSPHQVIECYKGIGKDFAHFSKDGHGWKRHRDLMASLLLPAGVCISCGWNSIGLGKERGFEIVEILLVSHGREHNDTIVTVERKVESSQQSFLSIASSGSNDSPAEAALSSSTK